MYSENQEAFIKAPLELAIEQFKTHRAQNQKQLAQILSGFATLRKTQRLNKVYTLESLQQMRLRLISLKQKMTEDYTKEKQNLQIIPKRIHYIDESKREQKDKSQKKFKTKKNIQIVEFFSINKKFRQAENLAIILRIQDYCDCQRKLIEKYWVIVDDLRLKKLDALKTWVKEHRKALKDKKSDLEFKTLIMNIMVYLKEEQQEMAIELLKKEDFKNMYVAQKYVGQLEKIMSIMVLGNQTLRLAYPELFSQERWVELQREVKQAYYLIYQIDLQSRLQSTVSIGMSIMKTPLCKPIRGNPTCPMCHELTFNLSRNVSMLCQQTNLICRVTKQQMNQDNPAFMLPNGQVFSRRAIEGFECVDDKIRCPFTQQLLDWKGIRRIYLA